MLSAAQVLLMMLVFLFGYVLGRRIGMKEGFTQAEKEIPLKLRRKTLEKGSCVICSRGSQENGIN